MNAPMNPNSSNKTQVPMATDISKRMGFNNFLRDVQGAAPTQPYVAPQMPAPMPQMAPNNQFMPQQQPMMPMMPPSSQAIRGGIGMQPVQGFDNGGVAEDPVFAAVRANNERARAEQEALEAYMASQASAGPTPLEIAQAGYLANQDVFDSNRPGMMVGEAGPSMLPLDEPLAPMLETAQTPDPVRAVIPANTGPVVDTGGISSVAPDPVSEYMGTGSEQAGFNVAAANRAAFEAQQAAQAAAYQEEQAALKAASNIANAEYLSSPANLDNQSTGPINVAEPVTPAPAPVQTMDQLEAALREAKDLDLDPSKRYKNRTSDLTGIKYTDKNAFEYDLGDEYDNVVAVKKGKNVFFVKDGERVDIDRLGLDGLGGETGNEKIQSLFGQLRDQEVQDVYGEFGGKDGDLVSSYLADQAASAANRSDKDAFYGKGADSTGKITSGKNRGQDSQALTNQIAMLNDPTRTGNILTDLQTAAKDPFGGLGDIGRSILDGSLFTPKDDQTAYKSVYDSVFGGGDDTPSGVISAEAPLGRPDGLDNFGYDEDENLFDSAIYNDTISDSDVETLKRLNLDGNQSGILPSSDLGRLVGGDQQLANDLMKLLAVDPDKTNEDLLSTARTTLGPDGLREADSDLAPFVDDTTLPLGPEDFAPYPLGGGADNNPNQNFGSDTAPTITSDLISLGDSGVGGVSPNINIDDGAVTSSGVLPSSLLGRIVGQESDNNFGFDDEMMGALETNLTRSDMDQLRGQEIQKLTAEVDALAEAQGFPKYGRKYEELLDTYYKRFSVPRILQGRSDILDKFREGYGPGSKVTIRDDSPVIGGVPQLGTLQNFDFTNQLQDRDMGGLGGNQVDLSGLPANVQGLPPSQLQLQDELNELKKNQVVDPEMDAIMQLNELKKSQVVDPEMDALMSGSAIPDYLTMNQPVIGGGVTPEFNEDDYTAITGRGGLPSYSKSMVNALAGAGGEDLSKAREQARSQKLNVDRFSGDTDKGNLDISGTPFGESLELGKINLGEGISGGDPNQFLENMGYGSRLNNPGEIGDYYVSGTDPEGNPVYRLRELEPRFNNLQVDPDGTLLDRFKDAQPEGALKGSIFDYVPDAEQLGNFMRGIIGPAGAAEVPVAASSPQYGSPFEGPDSSKIFTDMDGNQNVINPDGSITNIDTGQTDYSGLDLSGLPKTIDSYIDEFGIERGSIGMSDASTSNYGVGVPTAIGGESAGGSISDLLDNIKSGEIGTTFYESEDLGILLPSNIEFTKKPYAFDRSTGEPIGFVRGFTITNADGSKSVISQNNPEEFNSLVKQLKQNSVNIPAGAKIVDNPNTGDKFELGEDLQDKKIDFFKETPNSVPASLITMEDIKNIYGKDIFEENKDTSVPGQSAYNPNAVDLTKFMGGSGGLGSDMSPGTESNLLGDLGGFEQRFEDDTSIDSEIADLNNVSQLTDLTNLLTDSGLDAQTGNAISDTDAVEGLNILSSESSDSDLSASSGDVLANILNTGDNAAAEATDSASGTAGSASGGDGEVGGGSGGLTDGDLDVIGDAIGEMAGGDASGSGTGSGDGSGSGSGGGGGGSGGGGGGTSTGGEGDGEGDDDGDGDGEGEGGGGTTITVPPSGGDSKKSKQERRDYSRLREIIEQRARAPRGTAPGLGYKPVEGISNTLNKAADSFLDALKFG